MIKISHVRLLPLICFVMSIGILASCKKETTAGPDTVQLLSFGPTGAKHGDTLRFFGHNLNRVTSIEFSGAGATVAQQAFIQQTNELILVKVPNQAVQGFVTLKTSEGDVVSKTRFNLSVAFKVVTMTMQARPGENITLTGDFMNWVRRVTFNRDKVVTSFVNQSLNQLVVKVPEDAQTGPLVLFYAGTDSMNVETKDTLKVTLPMATGLSPSPVKHTDNLTITGTDLDLTKRVIFNGVSTPVTTFVSQTATQLVVTVPAGAKSGKVTLVAASGVQTLSTVDLSILLPVATAFSPNPVKHAENVTITGTNLDLTHQVIFTGAATPVTSFISQSATQLVVRVPAAAQSGKVTLVTSGVQSVSATDLNLLLPAVTGMAPNPVDPGTNLTITGTNLNLVTSVTFPNAPAVTSFVSHTASQIVVRVPSGVLRGKITLGVMNSTVVVQSNDVLEIKGDAPPPTIAFPFYNDAVTSNWNGWTGAGWGGSSDRNNTAPVREGSKSVKIDYVGGYGSPFQIGGANINPSNYTTLKVSLYGAAGSGGKRVNLGINGADSPSTFTLVEGKWTDYEVPISTLGISAANPLKEIILKEFSGTGGFTIYMDALGLN